MFNVKVVLLKKIMTPFIFKRSCTGNEKEDCTWDPYSSIYIYMYVQDLKSITVPLYLKGAKLFRLHVSRRMSSGCASLLSRSLATQFIFNGPNQLSDPACVQLVTSMSHRFIINVQQI